MFLADPWLSMARTARFGPHARHEDDDAVWRRLSDVVGFDA